MSQYFRIPSLNAAASETRQEELAKSLVPPKRKQTSSLLNANAKKKANPELAKGTGVIWYGNEVDGDDLDHINIPSRNQNFAKIKNPRINKQGNEKPSFSSDDEEEKDDEEEEDEEEKEEVHEEMKKKQQFKAKRVKQDGNKKKPDVAKPKSANFISLDDELLTKVLLKSH